MIHDLIVAAATLAVFVPTATVALALYARRYMRKMMRPKPANIQTSGSGRSPFNRHTYGGEP